MGQLNDHTTDQGIDDAIRSINDEILKGALDAERRMRRAFAFCATVGTMMAAAIVFDPHLRVWSMSGALIIFSAIYWWLSAGSALESMRDAARNYSERLAKTRADATDDVFRDPDVVSPDPRSS